MPSYRRPARRGPAPALALAPPVPTFDVNDGDPTRLRLRLRSPRRAAVIHARLAGETPFRLLRVDGEPPPPELLAAAAGGADELRLSFFAPPPEGLELELQPGRGRLELRLADQTWGLPAVGGEVPRRPPGLIPPAGWTGDSTLVSTRLLWPDQADGSASEGGEAALD